MDGTNLDFTNFIVSFFLFHFNARTVTHLIIEHENHEYTKNTFETRFIKAKYVALILKNIVNIILFASRINANCMMRAILYPNIFHINKLNIEITRTELDF